MSDTHAPAPSTPRLADIREQYDRATLEEDQAGGDPIALFRRWFDEAVEARLPDVNAMTLATVGADQRPSARIVLLKDLTEQGFTFFTNRESRKGEELAQHPHAALLFFWVELQRQVRIEGRVRYLDDAASDAYYASRPLGSRLGAWASPQSSVIPDRATLERLEADAQARFGEQPPRPPHWGGYVLEPDLIEFWQGRPSRLHDRLRYQQVNGQWQRERLAP